MLCSQEKRICRGDIYKRQAKHTSNVPHIPKFIYIPEPNAFYDNNANINAAQKY